MKKIMRKLTILILIISLLIIAVGGIGCGLMKTPPVDHNQPMLIQPDTTHDEAERVPITEMHSEPPIITVSVFQTQKAFALKVDASGPQIIFCIWADGTTVFSEDEINGGPPYFQSNIGTDKLDGLLETFEDKGLFCNNSIFSSYGPSSDFTRIYINKEGKTILWESWHELFEENPKLVVTDHGVEVLGNRNKDIVMSSCSYEYKEFRKNWDIVKGGLHKLIQNIEEKSLLQNGL